MRGQAWRRQAWREARWAWRWTRRTWVGVAYMMRVPHEGGEPTRSHRQSCNPATRPSPTRREKRTSSSRGGNQPQRALADSQLEMHQPLGQFVTSLWCFFSSHMCRSVERRRSGERCTMMENWVADSTRGPLRHTPEGSAAPLNQRQESRDTPRAPEGISQITRTPRARHPPMKGATCGVR